ncbi:hypothetical protein EVAR_45766_1 [Eumeta japonica]|uniref:Uncharacterized protein n=1 Tax=Eumeta variegata TaxID=151549 RepID=A0A4C1YZ23_EUMVA|nr:hypothetical protein EVAR_45766_1 [Eumeta japonica]
MPIKKLHDCRRRTRMKASGQINGGASTPAARAIKDMQADNISGYWCLNVGMYTRPRQDKEADISSPTPPGTAPAYKTTPTSSNRVPRHTYYVRLREAGHTFPIALRRATRTSM